MKTPPRDYGNIELTYITHFYCNKPGAFEQVASLLELYAGYPADVLDRIHFVIVDDASPVSYEIPDVDLNLTWLRITEDIPWNNPGARNLGVTYAKSDKVVITDLDHAFPVETLRHILGRPECGRDFFKLRRLQQGQFLKHSHPNIFLLSRARFLRLWGYDEHFCGHYGHDDVWFVKFQKWHGSRQRHLPRRYPILVRTDDTRSLTHTLERDLTTNRNLYEEKRRQVERFGKYGGHSRRFLDFEWKLGLERSRLTEPTLGPDRNWKRLWWLRLFLPNR